MAFTGDVVGMENLFSAGEASPGDVRPDGTSLLHVCSSLINIFGPLVDELQIAAQTNNIELIEYCLNKGLNANITNDEGETALHLAVAQSKDYNISRLLIEKGGDLNSCNIDGSSPLHTFFNDVVRKIVACHSESLETNTKNRRSRLLLHYFAWSSKSTVEDVKILLTDPALLTIGDDQGRTPLHYAALQGNVRLARYFLAQMPEHCKNQADRNGKSAFHYAVASKRTEILQLMENEGLSAYTKDSAHRGVLHEAARLNNLQAVKRVIALAGEQELEATDRNGKTPFSLAEDFGARQVTEYLQATYGFLPEVAGERLKTLKSNSLSHEHLGENKEIEPVVLKWLKLNLIRMVALFGVVLLAWIIFIGTQSATAGFHSGRDLTE